MPYLTFEEYNNLGFASLEEGVFDDLVIRSGDAIDSITRSFYQFNNLEDDVAFRRNQFKKAVASQVEYFHEVGSTTTYGMNEPSSVTIGRTSQSGGSSNSQTNSLLSPDVYGYLINTGLLYRGLGVYR